MRIHEVLKTTLGGNASGENDPFPTLASIVELLGPRSFGIVLVLFGLPNLLPIPGLPMVCGVIVGVVAYQMLVGRESLALPGWLGQRRLKRDDLSRVISKAEPGLLALERIMRPRIPGMTAPFAQRVIGAVLLVLAIALMAPIPFFGGIPPGIAVILFGLALTERDGLFVIAGGAASVAALLITALLTWAILKSVVMIFG